MCFLVDIAKIFDSISPVASVDLLFLIKRQCGMVSNKKGRSWHSTRYLNTLLVETIWTRFYWLTCRNQKLVQNKPLQQRSDKGILTVFLDILIANISWAVAQFPIRHIIFWKTVIKTFRSIYVNYFNTLRFLAEVSTKLQKMHFLDNLRTITQEGSTETRQMTPFFYLLFLL